MSQFNMIKESNDKVKIMTESVVLASEVQELKTLFTADGEIVQESVTQFVKDAREFVKHGLLPHYQKKSDADKEDENSDGALTDPEDKLWYFAKMVGGLLYYMKKDLKTTNADAFKMVVKGLIADKHIDQNVKAMAEKNLQSFIQKVAEKFQDPSVKSQLTKYLDDIETYFTGEVAPVKESEENKTFSYVLKLDPESGEDRSKILKAAEEQNVVVISERDADGYVTLELKPGGLVASMLLKHAKDQLKARFTKV